MKKTLLATALLALAAQSAYAQDSWTGGYGGIALGYHDVTAKIAGVKGSAHDTGLGVFGGYQQDLGQYVVGGEISYDTAKKHGVKINALKINARVGYDAGQFLPYVTAGFARVEYKEPGYKLKDNGYSIGIGLDYAVNQQFVIGGEISRTNTRFNTDAGKLKTHIDTFKIRGAYRF